MTCLTSQLGHARLDETQVQRILGESGCYQVHYCSIACQKKDWRAGHRVECQNFGELPVPEVDIETSTNVTEVMDVLKHIIQSCIARNEDHSWIPNDTLRAKNIGRRLYAIGGSGLCVQACSDTRAEFAEDKKRRGDASLLEIIWSDPVVPDGMVAMVATFLV